MSDEIIVHENQEWALLKKQCNAFIMSNMLPRHIYDGCKNEAQMLAKAITIAWKGRELGIPPLYALGSIAVINGKPALSSELMLSLVLKKYPAADPQFDSTNEYCSLSMVRPGGKPQSFKFTIEDAKKAGLLDKKGPWLTYPRAMLKARVISEACRSLFPDALMGAIYTPEELGHEIVDVEPGAMQTHQPIPSPGPTRDLSPKDNLDRIKGTTVSDTMPFEATGNTGGYDRRHEAKMSEPATEAQLKKLYAMGRAANMSEEDVDGVVYDITGCEHRNDLSKSDIQKVFEELETMPQ